jgi:hypothetical protein
LILAPIGTLRAIGLPAHAREEDGRKLRPLRQGMGETARDSAGEQAVFLSNLPAERRDRRLAFAVAGLSLLIFAATAPFARMKLPVIWAFIPLYESALAVNDLITALTEFLRKMKDDCSPKLKTFRMNVRKCIRTRTIGATT